MEKILNKKSKRHKLDLDSRYFLQNAEASMKDDVIRGLVELITNCDDSYKELEKNGIKNTGVIQISVERKRKGKNSIITVLDMAEGMTTAEMLTNIKRVGGKTSGFIESKGRKRGLMGRGSKECVVFGNLKFQSIKNGIYSETRLSRPDNFDELPEKKVTEIERVEIGIEKGNGTRVILEVEPQFPFPSHEKLVTKLPKYYSLRDIFSNPNRKLVLIDTVNPKKKEILSYCYHEGEVVFDEKIDINGYFEAEAHLIIKKISKRIKIDSGSPYWEGGIMVKSKDAIHVITPLTKKIENNPYFEYYFGRLTCPYIDDVAIEFEEAEEKQLKHSSENPSLIIDPLRSEGLKRNHPFTKALYGEAAKHINDLLKKDENIAKQKVIEIENKKTKDRFKKLAKEVSKFIKEHIEDIDSLEDENYLTEAEIPSGGMKVIPGGLKIPINEERKVYIYCRPLSEQKEKHVIISTESDVVELNTEIAGLTDRDDGILTAPLSIKGIKEGDTKIKLTWGNIDIYLPVLVVVKGEEIQNIDEFQFEKKNYSIKEGKIKNIKIFAQWPEFIHGRVKVKISITNSGYCELLTENIILDYDRKLKEVFGKGMAVGTVKLRGLEAGGPVIIKTSLQNKEISAKIRVIPKKELGKNFEIKIVDEDLGNQRALFDFDKNLIKINGRHKIIKRYLGPPPDFQDQDSIHFKLLSAELIADTVARRVLELNAQKNISEYKDMDVTGFYRKHREFMNAFLEKAHRIQIPENEIGNLKNN